MSEHKNQDSPLSFAHNSSPGIPEDLLMNLPRVQRDHSQEKVHTGFPGWLREDWGMAQKDLVYATHKDRS